MLSFQQGNMRFNYRVAGVAISGGRGAASPRREGRLLGNAWWGVASSWRTAQDTLRREMREEIAVDVGVNRLLWIVENFFAYEGVQFHEICMYFLMHLPDGCPLLAQDVFHGQGERRRGRRGTQQFHLIFQWFPLDTLDRLPLLSILPPPRPAGAAGNHPAPSFMWMKSDGARDAQRERTSALVRSLCASGWCKTPVVLGPCARS